MGLMSLVCRWELLVLVSCWSTQTALAGPWPAPAHVELYLVTIGRGATLPAVAGHSALRVYDRASGSDLVYNWGTYDPDEPGFIRDYVKGVMQYRLAEIPTDSMIRSYLANEPERS